MKTNDRMKSTTWRELKSSRDKKVNRESSWRPSIVERQTWKFSGWKKIDMANSFTEDTLLCSQMKKPGEKKMKIEEKPKK